MLHTFSRTLAYTERLRAHAQLTNPRKQTPAFKFGTTPFTSTEMNLRENYRDMYRYMTQYNTADVIEGVKAIKVGYDIILRICL